MLSKIGGCCLVVELAWGEFATNRATLSSSQGDTKESHYI